MGRPVWLLDVDGVLNANRPSWGAAPQQALVAAGGGQWKFKFSPHVTGFVRGTVLSGAAEVRWSTTWVPWRADVEAAFRLPEIPVAFTLNGDEEWRTVDEAKIAAALHVVEAERRPLVWTDDEVVPATGPVRERLESAGVPVLLLAPRSNRGLQPADVEAITEFLRTHG